MSGFLAYIMPVDTGRPDQGLPGGGGGGNFPSQGGPFPGQLPSGPGFGGGRPDNSLPGGGMASQLPVIIPPGSIDNELPEKPVILPPVYPTQPIYIPPGWLGNGKPEQPIHLPPVIDNSPPGSGGAGGGQRPPRPDQGLPPAQGRPDQGLPGQPPQPGNTPPGSFVANYAMVWVPGVGNAWLYIGGKPDQGLPEGGEGSENYPDQGLPEEGGSGGSQPSVDPRRRR